MKKVLMVLIVVTMYANSFGEVLVYKVSSSMSGYTVDPNSDPNTAQQFKGSIRGYVVVGINTTTLNTTNNVSNSKNKPAFIAVKDRSFVAFDGNNTKVQTEFNLTTAGDQYMQKFEILTKNGTVTRKGIVVPQFFFVYTATDPNLRVEFFQTQSVLTGQLKTVDIGIPIKAVIPPSIKGRAFYNVTTDSGGSQNSIGNVSFTLDKSFTQTANTGSIPLTVSETIDYIEQKLVKRGYTEVTFTKFFGQ
jgi:hypothetical protein